LNKVLLSQENILRIIRLTHRWLTQHVQETPIIAVTGLNPHCGDGGIFGGEEEKIILPAIQQAQREGLRVEGPFSADSLFPRARLGEYSAVIAMYHDQGMIPVKMESLGHAVNITLGLPIIRTSVDHGTAYDITGKGVASHRSLIEAIKTAALLAKSTAVLR
jgi:4-hydroxythreonine-4-phosphate dehydrogenase